MEPELDVRRAVVVGTAALLLVAGAGVTAYELDGDVPRGTRVLGVQLDGLSRTEAEQALHDRLDARAGEPLAIDLDGRRISVAPADIALRIDVDATVGRAIRSPARLFGTHQVAPAVRLDRDRLEAVLRRRLDPKRVTVRWPAITYAGLTPRPAYPQAGFDLDLGPAVKSVRNAWLTGRPACAGLVERSPGMTKAQVDAVVGGPATAAVAAPITVTVGATSFDLAPATIARALTFGSAELVPAIDAEALHTAAATEFARVETGGAVVDLDRLSTDLLGVLSDPAPRRVSAVLTENR